MDFNQTYSPVVNDVTVRLVNVIKLVQRLARCLVDVETMFLHGILGEGEEVYMDCPEGLEHEANECLLLLKTICRLKQSARAFFLTFSKVMTEAGFQPSKIDPCLFVKQDPTGTVYAIVWVDDCLFVGDKAAIEKTIADLEKTFKLKVEWNVRDCLSCDFSVHGTVTVTDAKDVGFNGHLREDSRLFLIMRDRQN